MINEIYSKLYEINSVPEITVNKDFWIIDGQDAQRLYRGLIVKYLDEHNLLEYEDSEKIKYFHINRR